MTSRLRLGLSGGVAKFRVSLPGYDVDAATFAQTLFDMDYGLYSGVFASGNLPFDANNPAWVSSNPGPNTVAYNRTVMFGKTFNTAPKIILSINDPYLGPGYFGPKFKLGTTGNQVSVGVTSFTDRMEVGFSRVYFSGSVDPFPGSVGYVIFHG